MAMRFQIKDYTLTDPLTTENAGMCQWGFAEKDGHDYFIKEFLSPKYPLDEGKLGPELTKRMRQNADTFFEQKQLFYERLACCRTGNIMIVLDFFRFGAKYYAVTDKVTGQTLNVEEISQLPEDAKRTLICSILYSISKLHEAGIVHSDLKPENILVKVTQDYFCTAKLIDFDAGFLEDAVPERIEGSQNYFSPEAVLKTNGKDVQISTKADVFALGLLFHQYWCGALPSFSSDSRYAAEAVLKDERLRFNTEIPGDVLSVIVQMLLKDPASRLTAYEAWIRLGGCKEFTVPSSTASAPEKKEIDNHSSFLARPSDDDL